MYAKPSLIRFGTLRELTLIGYSGGSDGWSIKGAPGCGLENTTCPTARS
jgi:hypothetical protein